MVSSPGGADGQVKAHVQANKNVGNDKATLIGVITQCLPYIGFPRTLNALAHINEILSKNNIQLNLPQWQNMKKYKMELFSQ